MSKEIQVSTGNFPSATATQTMFTHQGDNGVQIANQGTVNVFLTGSNGAVYNAATPINTECYNLFVIDGEAFNEPYFLIDKDRALTISEGISEKLSAQYAPLTPEIIAVIKTYPSLFTSKNRQYRNTDADHLASFGMVTDVKVLESSIKIYFQRFCTLPQQSLNKAASIFAIHEASATNELDRAHWAIKEINLIESLKAIGVSVPFPA